MTVHWCVYILRCSDDSYYVGFTDDLEHRLIAHTQGFGARWTARRRPVKLVYQETYTDEAQAIHRERQIKGWSRAKKEALIKGNMTELHELSRRRTGMQSRTGTRPVFLE